MTASTSYVSISRRALDLEDYIDVARRHASWIVGPLLAGTVIAVVVAFAIPNTYISQAQMQITPAQISPTIVPSTINQQLTERIMQMENEILSRTSLSAIIQDPKLDLYKSDRQRKPLEDVIETMRNRDIRIGIQALPGASPEKHGSAFTISFSYGDRFKAQQTVQALIAKFVEANLTSQRTTQDVVKNFVQDSLTDAKTALDKLDDELTRFRIENQGKLPEQSQMNIAQLTSLQQQSAAVNDALNRLAQERVQLDTHLQTLTSQKDLFNMFDREADVTNPVARQNERLIAMNHQIVDTESQLAQLRQIYKPNYPDIRDAENRLKVLRRERDNIQKQQDEDSAAPKPDPSAKKTNFASAQSLNAVEGQIDATKAQIQSLEMERATRVKQQEQLARELANYQNKLAATSGIEAKYADLIRAEKLASDKYQVLQQKQQLSDQNGEMIQRKAGENLEVLDPPNLPEQPTKPNRWMIVGAGIAVSFILGLALAGVQEAKDTSLKNLKDVRAYTNLPVLSSIPELENTMSIRRKRRIAYLVWTAAVIIGLIAVSGALYYHVSTSS